jgi:hypothetical protein
VARRDVVEPDRGQPQRRADQIGGQHGGEGGDLADYAGRIPIAQDGREWTSWRN